MGMAEMDDYYVLSRWRKEGAATDGIKPLFIDPPR